MKTFSFPSRSTGGTYTVTVDGQRITCTCRGFRTPSKCWHVREVAEKENIPTHATSTTPALPFAPADDEFPNSMTPPLGHFIEPMLASALPEGKSIDDYGDDWVLEEKYDGHRMILRRAPNGVVTAWARSGIVRILPRHIANLCQLLAPGTYDGELYLPGGVSTDVTNVKVQHKLHLVLFDLLEIGVDMNCRDCTLAQRRSLLEVATSKLPQCEVTIAPQFPVTRDGLQAIWDRGGEGAVIKWLKVHYFSGRRIKEWVKFKREESAEVIITGFKKGNLGPHSVICAKDCHGVEVQVKARNDNWRAKFALDPDAFLGQVLVISYQQKTNDGRYRHPMADHFLNFEME